MRSAICGCSSIAPTTRRSHAPRRRPRAPRIPTRAYGGLRFSERAEMKDALAYLRLIFNRTDDASFERIVNLPTRGIGAKTLDVVRNYARANTCSMWDAAGASIKEL